MRAISHYLALLVLPTLITAVSLADMAPRAFNLPPSCEKVYTADIPGCNDNDFATGNCSTSCISALFGIVIPVKEACADRGISGGNLIVAFLANVGPQQICPAAVHFGGMGPPPKWTSKFSSEYAAPSTTKHPLPPTPITTGTLTAHSLPGKPSSLLIDTSSTPGVTGTATHSSSSAASSTPGQLNTHDHSGGGSPFDTAGNTAGAAALSLSMALTIVSVVSALLTSFR